MLRALLVLVAAAVPIVVYGQSYRFEAELGTITTANSGNTRVQSAASASGGSYVGNFPNQDAVVDELTLSATVPSGLYDLYIGYRSPYGAKGYDLSIGSASVSGMFEQTTSFDEEYSGQFYLDDPTFDLSLREGWGYYDVDYFEFRTAQLREPLPVAPTLSNPAASPNTQYLMQYLTDGYGTQTLHGQQREYYNPDAILTPGVVNHLGGIMPAVIGGDLMAYSPSRVERHGGNEANFESERLIDWAHETGGVVSLMWHWNAPKGLDESEWWAGFYTDRTSFNLGDALANPSSPEYNLLLRDIDAISAELQKFKEADVPVLWRPLHEAQGNDGGAWFWWGDSGADALKELWGLMHDRMTNVHGLDNLIWVSTMQVDASDWQEWYPGDDLVDVVGVDIYSDDPNNNMSGQWLELLEEFDGRKLIALSETGSLPPEEVLERYGVAFSYMLPWNEDFLTNDQSAATVQGIVGDDDVIDLSELPVMPWRELDSGVTGDFDGDGDIDAMDYAVWKSHFGLGATPADANGNGRVDLADYTLWRNHLGQSLTASTTSVPEPATWILAIAAMAAYWAGRARR